MDSSLKCGDIVWLIQGEEPNLMAWPGEIITHGHSKESTIRLVEKHKYVLAKEEDLLLFTAFYPLSGKAPEGIQRAINVAKTLSNKAKVLAISMTPGHIREIQPNRAVERAYPTTQTQTDRSVFMDVGVQASAHSSEIGIKTNMGKAEVGTQTDFEKVEIGVQTSICGEEIGTHTQTVVQEIHIDVQNLPDIEFPSDITADGNNNGQDEVDSGDDFTTPFIISLPAQSGNHAASGSNGKHKNVKAHRGRQERFKWICPIKNCSKVSKLKLGGYKNQQDFRQHMILKHKHDADNASALKKLCKDCMVERK